MNTQHSLSSLRIASLLAVLFVNLARPAFACLQDRDTLAQEASGLPQNVIAAITGRFPRNPPLFYQMRIARIRSTSA